MPLFLKYPPPVSHVAKLYDPESGCTDFPYHLYNCGLLERSYHRPLYFVVYGIQSLQLSLPAYNLSVYA